MRSLVSLHKAQDIRSRVSLNLADIFGARKMTLMYVLSRNVYAAARQGPAVTVMPVFSPTKPSLLSNLLVFSHSTILVALPFLTVVLKSLQLVTFLNN